MQAGVKYRREKARGWLREAKSFAPRRALTRPPRWDLKTVAWLAVGNRMQDELLGSIVVSQKKMFYIYLLIAGSSKESMNING